MISILFKQYHYVQRKTPACLQQKSTLMVIFSSLLLTIFSGNERIYQPPRVSTRLFSTGMVDNRAKSKNFYLVDLLCSTFTDDV